MHGCNALLQHLSTLIKRLGRVPCSSQTGEGLLLNAVGRDYRQLPARKAVRSTPAHLTPKNPNQTTPASKSRSHLGKTLSKGGHNDFDNAIAFRLLTAHREAVGRQKALRASEDEDAIIASITEKLENMKARQDAARALTEADGVYRLGSDGDDGDVRAD